MIDHTTSPETVEDYELEVALRRPSEADHRLRISGIYVAIAEEVELDLGNGNVIHSNEYLERVLGP